MPYTYETVTINATVYAVYANVSDAQIYLQANITTPATEWLATDVVTQARSLVAATRWLDAEPWLGVPADTVTPQALQWPRTGLTDAYGNAIASTVIPPQVAMACAELAAALVDNPDARAELADPIVREQHAGTVGQTFFRPLNVQVLSVFPDQVMSLVGLWLAGQNATQIMATGTHGKNELTDDYPGVIHGF